MTTTYSESARSVLITQLRARQEIRDHGCDVDEFLSECGDYEFYLASDVLAWLGY